MKDINTIQKAINEIGEEGVSRYLPKGMKLCNCHMHGKYLAHYSDKNPLCPLCTQSTVSGEGNGTTASDVELFIDIRDAIKDAVDSVHSVSLHSQDV
jgi:hypothetical protein